LPIALSLTPAGPAGPPPALGEHSRVILREAGYPDAAIDELIRSGACGAEV
jgi:crotonobetainyl-CoA:carnitine CoA-transferase CaiB-like acyl-CoA transferase